MNHLDFVTRCSPYHNGHIAPHRRRRQGEHRPVRLRRRALSRHATSRAPRDRGAGTVRAQLSERYAEPGSACPKNSYPVLSGASIFGILTYHTIALVEWRGWKPSRSYGGSRCRTMKSQPSKGWSRSSRLRRQDTITPAAHRNSACSPPLWPLSGAAARRQPNHLSRRRVMPRAIAQAPQPPTTAAHPT